VAYIVTEPCIKCKYTDCVEVCPVDCFHEGSNFVVIDPEACIDCGVCEPECPTSAIVDAAAAPASQQRFVELNAQYAKLWPVIADKRTPLPDADQWSAVAEKFADLEV
jgi:ferredoxin